MNNNVEPHSVSQMNDQQITQFLSQRDALDHEVAIMERLHQAILGLPTPSNITWADAAKILDCPISHDETKIMQSLPYADEISEIPLIISPGMCLKWMLVFE